MSRRIIAAKPSYEHVQQIQSTLRVVEEPFKAKAEPQKTLADEIEACRKLIWQCVGGQQEQQEKRQPDEALKSSSDSNKAVESSPSASSNNKPFSRESTKKSRPSRVNIEFRVNAMKVVDLRKELRARGLDMNGLKKQLQSRLLDDMMQDLEKKQSSEIPTSATKAEPVKQEKTEKELEQELASKVPVAPENDDSSMSDANEEVVSSKPVVVAPLKRVVKLEVTEQAPVPMEEESVPHHVEKLKEETKLPESAMPLDDEQEIKLLPRKKSVEQGSVNVKQYWKSLSKPTHVFSAASPIKSPAPQPISAKKKKSPIRMVVKSTYKAYVAPSEPDSSHDLMIAPSKSDLSSKSDMSEEDVIHPVASDLSSASKHGSVRDLVSKIQKGSMNSSLGGSAPVTATGGSSTSALSKNLQAKKEARLKRMEEIRGKSKPVVTSKLVLAPKEYSSTLSSLNAVSAPGSFKTKNLASQMREKAAAAALRKENVSSSLNTQTPAATGTGKRNLPSSNIHESFQDTMGTTLKTFSKKAKVAASPMDTYEISDREESDSDSSDSETENEKQKKKIPVWAQKANLLPALEQQYTGCVAGKRADPDDIFPEVQSCDLEAIFSGKKSRYTRRTSSGNWTRDKVTAAEKLVYKRTMGFSSLGSN